MAGRRLRVNKSELKDKIAGALYGFAVGDSLGGPTEFMSANDIKKKYGYVTKHVGGGWLGLKPGECTDDTQMMCCIINALLDLPEESSSDVLLLGFMKNFSGWKQSKPKDIGGQCLKGIEYWEKTGEFIGEDDFALGNGGLMRSVPLSVIHRPGLNVLQTRLTHNNDVCARASETYSEALWDYMMGSKPCEEISGLLEPSGCVMNTLNNAMFFAQESTFSHAVLGAVNDGGDADTIAALAGGLAGARFGLCGIPGKFIEPLPVGLKEQFGKFTKFATSYVLSHEDVV